jgi:hypothetical protein
MDQQMSDVENQHDCAKTTATDSSNSAAPQTLSTPFSFSNSSTDGGSDAKSTAGHTPSVFGSKKHVHPDKSKLAAKD